MSEMIPFTKLRRFLMFALSSLAALSILWWLQDLFSLHEVLCHLGHLSPIQLALLALGNILVVLLLPGRWHLLLRAQGYRIPYLSLTRYRLAAFGLSYFTPGPQFGGEPLQLLLVERRHGVEREAALAAVALDKALELFVNFGVLLLGSLVVVRSQLIPGLHGGRLLMVAFCLFALPPFYLVLLRRQKRPLGMLLAPAEWLPGRWRSHGQLARLRVQEAETRAALLPSGALILAFLLSLTVWCALIAEFWLMFAFLGVSLNPLQLVIILTATRIGLLLPLPAGLGSLEAGLLLSLEVQGLPAAAGLGAAVLVRARDILLAAIGLSSLGRFRFGRHSPS